MSVASYQHLFFDLDHTLWDFERNSLETLGELYNEFDIGVLSNESLGTFIDVFQEVNAKLWDMYNRNKIEKFYIRQKRFELVFRALDVPVKEVPDNISELYLMRCPRKTHLLPNTVEILDYLKDRYQLHILSNGFGDVQNIKLENSGIAHYFDIVVNSESTGFKKPDRRIFEYALTQAGAEVGNSVMIGDNLKTDIGGARNMGIFHVFFNANRLEHFQQVDIEIQDLIELKKYF